MNKHSIRTLYLLRHAKAAKSTPVITDIDRPLNETGIRESYDMSHELFTNGEIPQLIVSSTATRAISTALIFQRVLNIPDESVEVTTKLYEIDLNDLYEFMVALDDRYHSVMLVGHNPAFSYLASKLDPAIIHMPTCSIIKFEFNVEKWRHCSYLNANQNLFIFP
jgi:phosphohistidine phosphatase